jgi:ribosomal protein S27E
VGASDCVFHGASNKFVVVFRVSDVVQCHVCGALLPLDEKIMSSW